MDLSTITVNDFKAYFRRDFLYLPVWTDAGFYNTGAVVYYTATELFYKAKSNGVTSVPTETDDWELQSGENIDDYVLDEDIEKAFVEAQSSFNQSLFSDDQQIRVAYYYLTAHYLVNDLRTSARGIQSAGESIVSSRTVGSVSESYSIPDAWVKDPILNFYTKSGYGVKYLSLIMPRLVGNIGAVAGWTNP